jgi:hypothetical protein
MSQEIDFGELETLSYQIFLKSRYPQHILLTQ